MGPSFKLDKPFDSLRAEHVATNTISGIGGITDDCSLPDPGDDCFDMPGLRIVWIYFKNHICSVFRLLPFPFFRSFCGVTRHYRLKQSSFFIKMFYNMDYFLSSVLFLWSFRCLAVFPVKGVTYVTR